MNIKKETFAYIINSVERHAFLSALYDTNEKVYRNLYKGINIDEELGKRGEKGFDDFLKELTISSLWKDYKNNKLILNEEAMRFIKKHQ